MKDHLRQTFHSVMLTGVLLVSSCGGGGSSGSGGSNTPRVNTVPVFTSESTIVVGEGVSNGFFTVIANDSDTDTLEYSIAGGVDEAAFRIASDSGALSFVNVPDFEVPSDNDQDNVYQVDVNVSDGNGGSAQISLEVRLEDRQEIELDAFVAKGVVSGAQCQIHALTAAGDMGDLLAEGQTLQGSVSFEQDVFYNGAAIVTCVGGSYVDEATGLTLPAPNLRSVVDVIETQTFAVTALTEIAASIAAEAGDFRTALQTHNDAVSQAFGLSDDITQIVPSDLTSSLLQNDSEGQYAAALALVSQLDDSSVGEIGEVLNDLAMLLSLNDGGTNFPDTLIQAQLDLFSNDSPFKENLAPETFVSIGNAADTGVDFSRPVITSANVVEVSEGSIDTRLQLTAVDILGRELSFQLLNLGDSAHFQLSSAGQLQFLVEPDFESPVDSNADNVYEISVMAMASSVQSEPVAIEVVVLDQNDSPIFSSEEAVFSVQENSFDVPLQLVASDQDMDALSYRFLEEGDYQLLTIDPELGVVRFVESPNFEQPMDANTDNTYQATAVVSDSQGGMDSIDISITVIDINDAPVFDSVVSISLVENNINTGLILAASDEDGDELSFQLTGEDAQWFRIDDDTNELVFTTSPDYEAPTDSDKDNVFQLAVDISDSLQSISEALDVTITDGAQLDVTIDFPKVGSNIGGFDGDIHVRGSLVDKEDGVVSENDISNFFVNDDVVEFLNEEKSIWNVSLSVESQVNLSVEIDIEDLNGLETRAESSFSNKVVLFESGNQAPIDSSYDQAARVMFFSPFFGQTLYSFSIDDSDVEAYDSFSRLAVMGVNSATGKTIAIARGGNSLLEIDLVNRVESVLFDGSNASVPFEFPVDLVVTSDGSMAYVLDSGAGTLLKVDLATGARTVVSDESNGSDFYTLRQTTGLTLDEVNGVAYVHWCGNCRVISIDLETGQQTLGDSFSGDTHFRDMEYDPLTANLYISDANSGSLKRYDPVAHSFENIDFDDTSKGAFDPVNLGLDSNQNSLIYTDYRRCQIGEIDLAVDESEIHYDCGVADGEYFLTPSSIHFDSMLNRLILTDDSRPGVYSMDVATGLREIISSVDRGDGEGFCSPKDLVVKSDVLLIVDSCKNAVFNVDLDSGDRTQLVTSDLLEGLGVSSPSGIAHDSEANLVYVSDEFANTVVSIDVSTLEAQIITGADLGSGDGLQAPSKMILDSARNRLLVATRNGLVAVDLASGNRELVTSFADSQIYDLTIVQSELFVATSWLVSKLNLDTSEVESVGGSSPSGARVVIGSSYRSLAVDSTNGAIFTALADFSGILEMDAYSGDTVVISR